MSYAELTANRLYEAMHLDSVSDEVKRHLIILMLSKPNKDKDMLDDGIKIPQNYQEAIEMGGMDLEMAREELHSYVDELATQYDIK